MTHETYAAITGEIEKQIGRVIVGQKQLVRQVVICLLAEGHALIEGVPGLGKTMLLRTLAQAVDMDFSRVQFTPDLMPADIVGTQVLSQDEAGQKRFVYAEGPIFANLLLADEINRATPKTQSALLEAMQERAVTVAGQTRKLPRPFFVMATQNPLEMEGTYPLPEAQLDRFLLKILVEMPEPAEIVEILQRTTSGFQTDASIVVDANTVRQMIQMTHEVPIAAHLLEFAARLVAATHPSRPDAPEDVRRYVRFGSSPRGAQAIVLSAKASALVDGRLNVSERDICSMVGPCLRHRIILSYEALADGISTDDVIDKVLLEIPSPQKELEGLG